MISQKLVSKIKSTHLLGVGISVLTLFCLYRVNSGYIFLAVFIFLGLVFLCPPHFRKLFILFGLFGYLALEWWSIHFGFQALGLWPLLVGLLLFNKKNKNISSYMQSALNNLFLLVQVPLKKSKSSLSENFMHFYCCLSAALFVKICIIDSLSDFSNWFILSYFNLTLANLGFGLASIIFEFLSNFLFLSLITSAVLALFGFKPFYMSSLSIFDLNLESFFKKINFLFRIVYKSLQPIASYFSAIIFLTLCLDFSWKGLVLGFLFGFFLILFKRFKISKNSIFRRIFDFTFLCLFIFLLRVQSFDEIKQIWHGYFEYEKKFFYPREYSKFQFAVFNFFILQFLFLSRRKISLYVQSSIGFRVAIFILSTLMLILAILLNNSIWSFSELIPRI